ncbi:hypothetical protein HDZ31DRAFT_65037 [Schizophyllum fasciatum]
MSQKPWMRCPLTGATEDLLRVKLIPLDFAYEQDEMQVACMEWFWGLKRGGLAYYLATAHNSLFFREDIAHMYSTFQFTLVPTFQTHLKIMDFSKRAGVTRRSPRDKSPRRPLTALTPSNGFYRYVCIPFSTAARKLLDELKLQPQTKEDMAHGLNPGTGRPWLEGSEAYPVVECFCHPFSACTLAEHAFEYNKFGNRFTSQWSITVFKVIDQWSVDVTNVPQSFINASRMDQDDITVTSSEEKGYTISSRSACCAERRRIVYEDDDVLQAKVSGWANEVDPDSKPEEQPPVPPSPLQVRRSERLKKKAHPYASRSPVYPPQSPVRRGIWPCDLGEASPAYPPVWAASNGRYPSRRFSSDDWAYFCYSVVLSAPLKS